MRFDRQQDFTKAEVVPMTSGNFETDFITNRECHVSFHIIFSIWQEKTFAAILVANTPLLSISNVV